MSELPFGTQYTDSRRVQTVNDEPSMTHQSFKDEQDVNFIIDRYTKTGHLPEVGPEGVYMDASSVEDFQTLMNNLRAVERAFEALPDDVRQEFQSPEDWINASLDEERLSAILDRHDSGHRDMLEHMEKQGAPQGGPDSSGATVEAARQAAESGASDPPAQ